MSQSHEMHDKLPQEQEQEQEQEQHTELNTIEPYESAEIATEEDIRQRVARARGAERQDQEVPQDKPSRVKPSNDGTMHQGQDDNAKSVSEQEKRRRLKLIEQLNQQFRVSENTFLFKDQPGSVAFRDKGKKLVSTSNEERVAKAMVTMADAKGWQTIHVSGDKIFQREVWLQASLRGIAVRGFIPQEQDLAALEARQLGIQKNVIEHEPDNRYQKQAPVATRTAEREIEASSHPDLRSPAQAETPWRYTGRILEHGAAHYQHDKNEKMSYFVKLATRQGEKTVWGVGLSRAIEEHQAKIGDEVSLELKGKEPVTVTALERNEQGEIIGEKEIETTRNAWKIVMLKKVELAQAVADRIINEKVKNPEHREVLKKAMADRLAEQAKEGQIPTVNVYDKNVRSAQKKPEVVLERKQDKEQSLEQAR